MCVCAWLKVFSMSTAAQNQTDFPGKFCWTEEFFVFSWLNSMPVAHNIILVPFCPLYAIYNRNMHSFDGKKKQKTVDASSVSIRASTQKQWQQGRRWKQLLGGFGLAHPSFACGWDWAYLSCTFPHLMGLSGRNRVCSPWLLCQCSQGTNGWTDSQEIHPWTAVPLQAQN